jgi:hypothetical protein
VPAGGVSNPVMGVVRARAAVPARRRALEAALGAGLLVGIWMAGAPGCASGGGRAGAPKAAAPNSGLTSLAAEPPAQDLKLVSTLGTRAGPLSEAEKAQLVQQAVDDLRAFQNRNPGAQVPSLNALLAEPTDVGSILGAGSTPPPGEPIPTPPEPTLAAPTADVLAASSAAWNSLPPPKAARPAAPSQLAQADPDEPVAELARRMAALLRGVPGSEKVPDAVALAAIESVRPGILSDLESEGNVLGRRLSEQDRRTLIDARERTLKDPDKAGEALVRSLARITPPSRLKVLRAQLCRRVEGYGRYEPFASDTFAAGAPIRMIVYTEIDGFAARPAREGDPVQPSAPLGEQLSVELAQSLTLYHDPSGLQAWHVPAQRVVETSRVKRRDFYLIHRVELPATLTVGRYLLKVTVTDKTTGVSDEVNLPINVVAAIRTSR